LILLISSNDFWLGILMKWVLTLKFHVEFEMGSLASLSLKLYL
jgi:hypothetical protein